MVAGEATGLEQFTQLNPVDGLHEYEIPPDPTRVVLSPEQIVTSFPAFALGSGTTVIILCALLLHP